MALENDDLLVVQKSGGGELRKVKISDVKGGSLWTEDSGKLYPTTLTNDVQVGGTSAAPNISLNADGLVKAKDYATGTGVALTYWGEVIARNDSANAASFSSYQEGTSASNVKARIYSDGNAYFGGYIFQGNPLHNPNIALNASDGSASFTKAVQCRNYFADTGGIQINENGVFIRSNDVMKFLAVCQ